MLEMHVVDAPAKTKEESQEESYSNVGTVKDSSFTDSYVPKLIEDELED